MQLAVSKRLASLFSTSLCSPETKSCPFIIGSVNSNLMVVYCYHICDQI